MHVGLLAMGRKNLNKCEQFRLVQRYQEDILRQSEETLNSEVEALPAFKWHGSKQKSISHFRCSLFLDEVRQVM